MATKSGRLVSYKAHLGPFITAFHNGSLDRVYRVYP